MKLTFIRHAESHANAGLPCSDFALIPLTKAGEQQAQTLANTWAEPPDHIICSPFLRTRQTAQPTIDRFPQVPVSIWPVHEFTNLQPSRWNGSLPADRLPAVEAFWQRCDPSFCDGEGAESFSHLLGRAHDMIQRLQAFSSDTNVLVFSHGFFLHAVRLLLQYPARPDVELMAMFVPAFRANPIPNAERLTFSYIAGLWQQLSAGL